MQWLLVVSGIVVVVASLAMVVMPYLRGRADLLTAWSLFLLGFANFAGISAIQSGSADYHLYGMFGDNEYWRFALGSIVFLVAVTFAYHKFKWPRRLAQRRMHKLPPATMQVMFFGLMLCWVLTTGGILAPNVQFIGQILILVGWSASNYAIAFAFYIWDERRFNPAALALLLGAVAFALVVSIGRGSGRIYLLTTLLTVPFCWYWKTLRYKPVRNTLIPLGVGTAVTFFLIAGYSTIRHARKNPDEGLAQVAMTRLKAIPAGFRERKGGLFGGDTTDVSLLAIQRYTTVAKPQPFFTVIYVLSNPIPRAWWPDKIGALGETLPRETGMWLRSGYISLGPGVIGHGYHEGGLIMIVFYGFLLGCGLRFIDELLMTRSDNPFLVGMIASVGGFLFALPRGELGLYIIHVIAGFLTGFIVNVISRMLFGTVYDSGGLPQRGFEIVDPATAAAAHDEEYAAWR
jgi:hypothetical protein